MAAFRTFRPPKAETPESLVELMATAEQVLRRDPDHLEAGPPEQLFAIDIVVPLPAIDAVAIAFILERDSGIPEQQVGAKHNPAVIDRHRSLHEWLGQPRLDEPETEQRFRWGVSTEANAFQCPSAIGGSALSAVAIRSGRQARHVDHWRTLSRSDEEISCRDEVGSPDLRRQLAPDIDGRARRVPVAHDADTDIRRDPMPDDASGPWRRSR